MYPGGRLLQLAAAPAFLCCRHVCATPHAQAQDLGADRRRASTPGIDGRLVYVPDEQGNTIHDASHAGYRGGGVADSDGAGQRNDLAGRRRQYRARPGGHRQSLGAAARCERIPRRRAPQSRLLPHGHAAADSGERRGVARRRHGRHRHRPDRHGHRSRRAGPARRPGRRRNQGTLVADRRRVRRDAARRDHAQTVTDDYVPVGARRFRVASARGLQARRHGASCGASATRHGSTPSA